MTPKEKIQYLVELGENMTLVNLGSLLNTFEDMMTDYNKQERNRYYSIYRVNERGETVYVNVLYAYHNENNNYIVHFFNPCDGNLDKQRECKITDNVLIIKVFIGSLFECDCNRHIFCNKFYYHNDLGDATYDTVINKEYIRR